MAYLLIKQVENLSDCKIKRVIDGIERPLYTIAAGEVIIKPHSMVKVSSIMRYFSSHTLHQPSKTHHGQYSKPNLDDVMCIYMAYGHANILYTGSLVYCKVHHLTDTLTILIIHRFLDMYGGVYGGTTILIVI